MKFSEFYKQVTLYHVTQQKNVSSISDHGIVPKKKATFTGAYGQDVRHKKNAIYAFENIADAIALCFKMKWDLKEKTDPSIIEFKSNLGYWEEDSHWESQTGYGKWLVSTRVVPPSDIVGVKKYNEKEMIPILKKAQDERFKPIEESFFPRSGNTSASHMKQREDIINNPSFKKWFGKSQVVDGFGNPLVVYHATNTPKMFRAFMPGSYGGAIFFADNTDTLTNQSFYGDTYFDELEVYAPRTIPVYLRAEKLFDVDNKENMESVRPLLKRIYKGYSDEDIQEILDNIEAGQYDEIETTIRGKFAFLDGLKKMGYDGFTTYEGDGKNYAVFSPYQIKSAMGNKGTFNPKKKNIDENK